MKETKSKYEILVEEISIMADKTSTWSRDNKKKSFNIYIWIAISSAGITLLVAIANDIPENLSLIVKVITLILSGITTVLAAWDGFYNHKQLWINYGETRNYLRSLQLKLKLLKPSEREDDSLLRVIYEEYQDVLQNGNTNWKALRMEESKNTIQSK
ncbi:MAG: DUF4231 domain-containing protein [Crocinitomicaceae bacterium]|nr:DUF4231 domain-containing protein [Flavobacteriales bacterium]NQZ36461.1 DUF4231 domain-containing protein [Crocinitomicaceae bacterium]